MQSLADASKRLHLMIDACAADAQSDLAFWSANDRHGYTMEMHAKALAAAVAETSPRLPPMFASRPALAAAWNSARHWIEEQQRRERLAGQIRAGEWAALGVPCPMDLLAELLANGHVRIHGTSLYYDRPHNLTWYINAYGVENVWCQQPTHQSTERFIVAALLGSQFGLIPEGMGAQ